MKMNDEMIIVLGDPKYEEKARALSEKLGVPITGESPGKTDERLILLYAEDGLSLCRGNMEVRGDLTKMIPRIKERSLRGELLVRAAGRRDADGSPTAIDATAGLGEDSLLLASAGFSVTLCERDPVIATLLCDSIERALSVPELADAASRMTAIECDSIGYMRGLSAPPDVIFLDPMFPEKEKSGLTKKKLQLLQRLEAPCSDEEELLSAAIGASPRRIVIKRPLKGPFLAGRKPTYSIFGKVIRYDCID